MINKVVIRLFKRFKKVEFDLHGKHVILAGPNNTGKTTVLQAIAACGFALNRWRQRNDYNQRRGWVRVPVTRQQFTPVSVRSFDLLWNRRNYAGSFQIILETQVGRIGMEFEPDSVEQIYVRPVWEASASTLKNFRLETVFVPAMTGLAVDETTYKPEKVEQFIGLNRPGEVLRNLLLMAYNRQDAWDRLSQAIESMFGIELLPPDDSGADIIAEYRHKESDTPYDIASAGSGFQQVLMLLTYLNTRPGSVLLIDEPDAHLHVFLQEAILNHLRSAAAESHSQIIAATHSEVLIDSVRLDELYVLLDEPVRLVNDDQRDQLVDAIRVIDHIDLMKARMCPGILYLEDFTDLDILRTWARVLAHPAQAVLGLQVYWRKTVADAGEGKTGVKAREHFDALQLARPGFPALQIVDGDSKMSVPSDVVTGKRPPTTRWSRYEIESYLIHPAALERFVEKQIGSQFSAAHREEMRATLRKLLTSDFVNRPLEYHEPAEAVLETRKAREKLLPPVLSAGGLPGFDYTRFWEIAAEMRPEEIHPEVSQKLNMICEAFGVPVSTEVAPQPGTDS